jgi:hypothetical protein
VVVPATSSAASSTDSVVTAKQGSSI